MVFRRFFDVMRSYVGDVLEGDGKKDWGKEEWKAYREYKEKLERDEANASARNNRSAKDFDRPSSNLKKEDQYFSYLELERTNDFTVIKKQYRKMMKKYHPDRFQGNEKQKKIAEQITRQLNEAYDYFERRHEESES